jgi:hypothetical protein
MYATWGTHERVFADTLLVCVRELWPLARVDQRGSLRDGYLTRVVDDDDEQAGSASGEGLSV